MTQKHILLIDIGNSSTTIGFAFPHKPEKIIATYNVETKALSSEENTWKFFKQTFAKSRTEKKHIEACIIASVVPRVTKLITTMSNNHLGLKTTIIKTNSNSGLTIDYDIKKLGVDRFVNAVSSRALYKPPLIIVDVGTAVTIDIVSKHNIFHGGVIFPGLGITKDILKNSTAQLPNIKLKKPKKLLGKNTEESITSGMYYSFLGSIEHIVNRIKKISAFSKAQVLLTGGYTFLYADEPIFDIVDKNLTLKGIGIIYSKKYKNNA